jgi:hypothetical protein
MFKTSLDIKDVQPKTKKKKRKKMPLGRFRVSQQHEQTTTIDNT